MDPNFTWLGSEKRNAVSLVGAEKVGAFFTGNKCGLMLRYLRLFKSFDMSLLWFTRGTDWALRETSGKGTDPTYDDEVQSMQCRNHLDALTCLLSVQ